jgi:methylglyoxal/glyoxal reductase
MIERLQFPGSWRHPLMPGYGTFPYPFASAALDYRQTARDSQSHVEVALAIGYRHLDTAFSYQNQDLVGAAIRAQGIPRPEIFVTSKLHSGDNYYRAASMKIREAIQLLWGQNVLASDQYLDAFLLHYPGFGNPVEAWKALIEARQHGLVRQVGVSNFEIRHLEKLNAATGEYPALNQIELHPYLYVEQKQLLEFCRRQNIVVEGYSPLAEGQVLADPVLQSIAKSHGTSPARIALRWCMQHGVRPIVGTRNRQHLQMNAEPYTFTLTDEQMLRIDSLGNAKTMRVSLKWNWDPPNAPLGCSKLVSFLRLSRHRFLQGVRRAVKIMSPHSGKQAACSCQARPPMAAAKNDLMKVARQD